MSQWKKSSDSLMELHAKLASAYNCTNKPMFGFQVFFVNDNMFTGIYEDGITLRLSADDRDEILTGYDEITPFAPLGRTMKEYVLIPEHFLDDGEFMRHWMDRSYAYLSSLPPKSKKEKKAR